MVPQPQTPLDSSNNNKLVHRHHYQTSTHHPYYTFQHAQSPMYPHHQCCPSVTSQMMAQSPPSPSTTAGGTSFRSRIYPYLKDVNTPLTFEAPELSEETILNKSHNETLAKLNFVLALVDTIFEMVNNISNPITVLSESTTNELPSEEQQNKERFVLYFRCLTFLASALKLSQREINANGLLRTNTVRNVLKTMKDKYHKCLDLCKDLNSTSNSANDGNNSPAAAAADGANVETSVKLDNISADKIIYDYALKMCRNGATEEMVGSREVSFKCYQTAQILLHSLSFQTVNEEDRSILNRYQEAVEKRLYILQSQGSGFNILTYSP